MSGEVRLMDALETKYQALTKAIEAFFHANKIENHNGRDSRAITAYVMGEFGFGLSEVGKVMGRDRTNIAYLTYKASESKTLMSWIGTITSNLSEAA